MVNVSHEIWALGLVALLIGILILKAVFRRLKTARGHTAVDYADSCAGPHQDIEHRALMYLMAAKTDSLLGALAKTIEQERQKLGGVVRNPSMEEALDRLPAVSPSEQSGRTSNYEAIGPMARQGMDAASIAHQLRMPEEEVALAMRLKAA